MKRFEPTIAEIAELRLIGELAPSPRFHDGAAAIRAPDDGGAGLDQGSVALAAGDALRDRIGADTRA
jgi:hypothetical protein